ncbi:hypothetical protein K3495_g2128 [Podosphaera aphanis]|nr:hypothetical protein K3495_g2128 [Podosphaera aphanis]
MSMAMLFGLPSTNEGAPFFGMEQQMSLPDEMVFSPMVTPTAMPQNDPHELDINGNQRSRKRETKSDDPLITQTAVTARLSVAKIAENLDIHQAKFTMQSETFCSPGKREGVAESRPYPKQKQRSWLNGF